MFFKKEEKIVTGERKKGETGLLEAVIKRCLCFPSSSLI